MRANHYLNFIKRSQFLRNVTTLLSGKMAALVLSIALVPVIARLFEPADFGVMAVFLAIANGMALILPLRYYRASLLVRDDAEANVLLAMSIKLLVVGCLVVLALIALVRLMGLEVGFLAPLGFWIWLIPLGVFLDGMSQIMTTVHSRSRTYRAVAVADVSQTVLMGVSRILAGVSGSSVWGLIVGYMIGAIGRIWLLAKYSMNPLPLIVRRISWVKAKELAIEYRDYPLHNMTAAVVTFLSGKMPIFLLGMMFAPAVVGFYAMADRLIRLPVVSAAIAIREVFLRKLAGQADGKTGFRRSLTLLTIGMLLLGLAPFGLLGLYGADMLVVILGDRWADSGVYVQILAPWYYAAWVNTGVQPTFVALRRQSLWLRIQIGTVLSRASVFGLGYFVGADVETVLVWFSVLNVVSALSVLAFIYYLLWSQNSENPPTR